MSEGKKFLLIFFIKVISRKTKLLENYFVQKLFQSIKKKKNYPGVLFWRGSNSNFWTNLVFIKNFMDIQVTVVWE